MCLLLSGRWDLPTAGQCWPRGHRARLSTDRWCRRHLPSALYCWLHTDRRQRVKNMYQSTLMVWNSADLYRRLVLLSSYCHRRSSNFAQAKTKKLPNLKCTAYDIAAEPNSRNCRIWNSHGHLTALAMAILSAGISAVRFLAVSCGWMIHPTANVPEEVNRDIAVQLPTPYTDPERHDTHRHRQTDGQSTLSCQ